MTLKDLEATFIRYTDTGYSIGFDLQNAQGILFLCPLCFVKNNGSVGTHSVVISFADRNVRENEGSMNDEGKPSRWNIIGGSGLDDLQLSPSIHLKGSDCGWHGFIGNSGVPPGHAA